MCQENKWPFSEPFSEQMIDDDAGPFIKFLLSEKEAWRNALAKTSPLSVVTHAERDPYATVKQTSSIRKKRATDSRPKGDHNVFTNFPEDLHCKVCWMTKTTRANCKNRPMNRADGISRPSLHKTLNLGDESRNDHRIVPVAQDSHPFWIQSCPAELQSLRSKRQEESSNAIQGSLSKRVRTYNGHMTRILLIVQKPMGAAERGVDE